VETKDLKVLLGLPSFLKGAAALNRVIRQHMPGGDELLSVLTRLHEAQHGRRTKDHMLQDLLDALVQGRNKMADAILRADPRDGVLPVVLIHTKHSDLSIHAEKSATDESCQTPQELSIPVDGKISRLGTMPDTRLAVLWGVSHTAVAKMRKRYGIKPYMKSARVDWAKWDEQINDPDMSSDGLARLIGCDISTVRERRRFLAGEGGKYYVKIGRPKRGHTRDWGTVDWSRSDTDIARDMGVSPQAVWKQRQKRTA
jgi:hypothetical protein